MAKSKPRMPMPVSERAKQFMPFSALKGLSEALAEREKIRVPKIAVSDDMAEQTNQALQQLSVGEIVTVVYYNKPESEYIQLTGPVTGLQKQRKVLQIASTEIKIDDIFEIIS